MMLSGFGRAKAFLVFENDTVYLPQFFVSMIQAVMYNYS